MYLGTMAAELIHSFKQTSGVVLVLLASAHRIFTAFSNLSLVVSHQTDGELRRSIYLLDVSTTQCTNVSNAYKT